MVIPFGAQLAAIPEGGFDCAAVPGRQQASALLMLMLMLMLNLILILKLILSRQSKLTATLNIWADVWLAFDCDIVCQTTSVCGTTVIATVVVWEAVASAQIQP